MRIIADTHVHLYPCYDLHTALKQLEANLGRLDSNAIKAGFLTERCDCHYFEDMKEGKVDLHVEILAVDKNLALVLGKDKKPQFFLFAGYQVVTSERLEILALICDSRIPDGRPATEVVKTVMETGGIPVLSWSPGKWLLGRGRVVRELIESCEPGRLLIGDTTLRPTIWSEPLLMRMARKKGLAVVAGSDPLPFRGEEKYMGTYASIMEGSFDPDKPVSSVRKMLTNPVAQIVKTGKRCRLMNVLCRLVNNAMLSSD